MASTRPSSNDMPPPLPPRGKAQINGVADARNAFPSATVTSQVHATYTPPALPLYTISTSDSSFTSRVGDDVVDFGVTQVASTHCSKRISISATADPIAATQQFSISTNTVVDSALPAPTPLTSTPVQHRQLKRNNSYRLANDEVKLETNKENLLIYAEDSGALTLTKATFMPPTQNNKSQQHNGNNNNSQNNSHTLPHASGAIKFKNTNNLHNKSTDNGEKSNGQRKMTKSFERLVDEFSLSTTSIDSSYLRNKSLENFDDSPSILNNNIGEHKMERSEAEDSDSEPELELSPPPSHTKFHKSFIDSVLLKPFKVVRPTDENDMRRRRILQKFEVTEIW
ncbi:retinoblastoma-like protein A [Bactrocera oleae]|uniref:retinoblastoma-like protein A n=1 Tax=Bactrocera oleae TaxID=104688 RepID=UPI00387E9363